MKITDIKTYITKGRQTPWIFVQVFTDEGLVGTGDATNYPGALIVNKAIEEIKPLLIGENPFNREMLWEKMYRGFYYTGIAGAVISAISGIDIALWDIMGKAFNTPVYNLLGGLCHEKLRLYCTHFGHPEDLKEIMDAGFTAVKLSPYYPILGEKGMFDNTDPDIAKLNRSFSNSELNSFVDVIKNIRKEAGKDFDIAIDAGGSFNVDTAIRFANKVEEFDLLFLEEPVPPENIDAMLKVSSKTNVPICTGERIFTRFGFRTILEKQAADIIMPDIVRTGGISEAKKIATMAEIYYVPVAPHNPNSPISTIATAHLCSSLPNFLILEYISSSTDVPWRDELISEPLNEKNGYLTLSDKPGLGITLNMKAVNKYKY